MRGRGYTLVEILIGITILSFLFVGGYTAYRDFARRQILNTSAEELKANLATARENALNVQRPPQSECNDNFLGYLVIFTSTSYVIRPDCDVTDPGVLSAYYKTYTLPSVVTASVAGTQVANQILFKPIGGGTDILSAQGATITLTHSQTTNVLTLTVNPSGAFK